MKRSDFEELTRAEYDPNDPIGPECRRCGSHAIGVRRDAQGDYVIVCKEGEDECGRAVAHAERKRAWMLFL